MKKGKERRQCIWEAALMKITPPKNNTITEIDVRELCLNKSKRQALLNLNSLS
jgi:hypothetical protein